MTDIDVPAVAADLSAFESALEPRAPERSDAQVLAYGEISAALVLAGRPALAGLVVKRMSGFADDLAAKGYVDLVTEYLQRLSHLGMRTLTTVPVTVDVPGRRPSVYLVQPRVEAATLGHRILHEASDDDLALAMTTVLDQTLLAFSANAANPADQISVDEQLSNWSFDPLGAQPVLIDVGTPFIRRGGRHAFDQEILLSAVPPGIRNYYRWKGTAAEYMDDYFEPRLIAVDMLGNFHKEGAPQRIPLGLQVVNAWLGGPAAELQDRLAAPGSAGGPVVRREVDEYYKQDAATLELFLRVRRLDRALRRLLRRRYDFILPGPVSR